MKKFLLFNLCIFFTFFRAFSEQDIKLTVSKDRLEVDEVFRINLEIYNNMQAKLVAVPENENMLIRETGTSSSFTMINGEQTTVVVYSFNAKFIKSGIYQVGPFKVKYKDKIIDTNVANVEIVAPEERLEPATGSEVSSDSAESAKPFILDVVLSSKSVVANEFIDIKLMFYARDEFKVIDLNSIKLPDEAWVETFKLPKDNESRVVINGVVYRAFEVDKKRIFISKPGTYTIKPAILNLYSLVRNGFFAYYDKQITVKSNAPEIVVGQNPANVTAVGDFKLYSTISDVKVSGKGTVSINIKLTGEGNFQNIEKIGVNADPEVEIYQSKNETKTVAGGVKEKSWDMVVIPEKNGKFNIAVDDFKYYNIKTKNVQVIQTKPFTLSVSGLTGESTERKEVVAVHKKADDLENDGYRDIPQFEGVKPISNELLSNVGSVYRNYNVFIIVIYSLILLGILLLLAVKFSGKIKFVKNTDMKPSGIADRVHKIVNNEKLRSVEKADKLREIVEDFCAVMCGVDRKVLRTANIKSVVKDYCSEAIIRDISFIIDEIDLIRFCSEECDPVFMKKIAQRIIDLFKEKR